MHLLDDLWGKEYIEKLKKNTKGNARWHSLDNLLWKKLWIYSVTNNVVILMCKVLSVHTFTPHYAVT